MVTRSSNLVIEPRVDFERIPLSALRKKSRDKLSILLNPEKVLVSEDGHFRDWRGIFSLSGLTQSEYTLISQSQDKTNTLLDLWIRKSKENDQVIVSISQLQQCLELIDRYDIHDDTFSLFCDDAQAFLSNPQPAKNRSKFDLIKAEPDNDIITMRDIECIEQGLTLPIYDALVIYNDKDIEFATELIERLETKGYLLCAKDRDLLPGLSFESDAILNLLSKRCNRLVIIVSKAFLSSPMQIFITNFAQALGIEQGQRKIIPCLLEPCDLPQMLRYCFRLDFYRNNKLFDFWDKLDKSLKVHKRDALEGSTKKAIGDSSTTQTPPLLYKFADSSSTDFPEKSTQNSFNEEQHSEANKQIMPPLPRLRSASSMESIPNNKGFQNSMNHSHSTLVLNRSITETGQVQYTQKNSELKRKKWYSMFLPPKDAKIKTKVLESVLEDESVRIDEKKPKKRWFKSKKKRDKQKEKVVVTF